MRKVNSIFERAQNDSRCWRSRAAVAAACQSFRLHQFILRAHAENFLFLSLRFSPQHTYIYWPESHLTR
jgi:hypothetical protein